MYTTGEVRVSAELSIEGFPDFTYEVLNDKAQIVLGLPSGQATVVQSKAILPSHQCLEKRTPRDTPTGVSQGLRALRALTTS